MTNITNLDSLKKGKLYKYKNNKNDIIIMYLGNCYEKGGPGGWLWWEYEFLYGKDIIFVREDEISFYLFELEEQNEQIEEDVKE